MIENHAIGVWYGSFSFEEVIGNTFPESQFVKDDINAAGISLQSHHELLVKYRISQLRKLQGGYTECGLSKSVMALPSSEDKTY